MSCTSLTFYLFLLSGLVNSQDGGDVENGAHCFQGRDASKEIKSWVKNVVEEETENYSIEFFDISFAVVRSGEGIIWHIVSDGLQGAFYFEKREHFEDESEEEEPAVYLYPDYSTAIVGIWKSHLLVSGRSTKLVEACRTENAWTLKFGDQTGPIMTYSPPSHYSLGVHPLQRDPYEENTVEVLKSLLPGGNDGLFTKRDIQTGDILAFYGGYMISCNSSLRALDRREYLDKAEHHRNMYSLSLGLEEDDNYCLDLPPELGNDVNKYNATLGHKLNHRFEPNVEFLLFSVHPVLGTIMSLSALEDIPSGTELTVNYGYDLKEDPDQPEWFKEQWVNFYGEDIGKEEIDLEDYVKSENIEEDYDTDNDETDEHEEL